MKLFFSNSKELVFCLLATLALLSGCATVSDSTSDPKMPGEPRADVTKFSDLVSQQDGYKGWYIWSVLPNKKKTNYRLQKYQGKTVLHADASSSASGLAIPLKPKDVKGLEISWSWKALNQITTADVSQGSNDDAPLRLMLAFDGDKTKLSFKDQMALDMAQLISGHDMPYATLMYVWGNGINIEAVIPNAHSSRVRMIVVDGEQSPVGQWRKHSRDIAQDYQKAFGETPGKLIGIGVMTDTDNTKSNVNAIYGDIELHPRKVKTSSLDGAKASQ
jgi:hypothetical protein